MDELLSEYSKLGGTPTTKTLDALFPHLDNFYSNPLWDNKLRTHIRNWVSSEVPESIFYHFIIQALEISLHSLSRFNIDENSFYLVLEESVELCPRSCLSLLMQSLENGSSILQKVHFL